MVISHSGINVGYAIR